MTDMMTIPRAADLRPHRRGAGGKPYIGPKVQVNIPPEHYDFVLDLMEREGMGDDRWADALRAVVAAGVTALGFRGEA
jgi:hypothetical protein